MCTGACGGYVESGISITFVLLFFGIPIAGFLFSCLIEMLQNSGSCNSDLRTYYSSTGTYILEGREPFDRIDENPPDYGVPEYIMVENEDRANGEPEYVMVKYESYYKKTTVQEEDTMHNKTQSKDVCSSENQLALSSVFKKSQSVCSGPATFFDELDQRIKKRAVMLSTLKDIESGKVDPNEIIGNRERVLVLARKSS